MATETLSGPLGELRAASTAGGGTALTTTAVRTVLPLGTKWVSLTPRNFSTAVVAQILTNPWLTVLKTTDGGATFTDYSTEAQDGSTSTSVVLSSLNTLLNGDALYVGSHIPFSGVAIDVDGTNSTASVTLEVKYRKSDNTWATITPTDGTASGGTTLAQDGSVTWTVPADWITCSLTDTGDSTVVGSNPGGELYWTRWAVDVALDASVTLDHMLSINRSTVYAELVSGQTFEEAVTVGPGGIASVQARTDAGTASLIVNASTRQNGRFA